MASLSAWQIWGFESTFKPKFVDSFTSDSKLERENFKEKRLNCVKNIWVYSALYFWYKRNRAQHEQQLDPPYNFDYYGINANVLLQRRWCSWRRNGNNFSHKENIVESDVYQFLFFSGPVCGIQIAWKEIITGEVAINVKMAENVGIGSNSNVHTKCINSWNVTVHWVW